MIRRKALLFLLLFFWAISLRHLTVIPIVHEDEPWLASTGWKLAAEGVFASDVFAGYYGMEEHYYGFLPLFPALEAVIFRLGGLGLFQARLVPVLLGMLTLTLTVAVGRRLFGVEVGLLAAFLLLVTRSAAETPGRTSGILFLDLSRVARYDALVPVFGLAALLVVWPVLRQNRPPGLRGGRKEWRFFAAGLLTALAGLSHLYGLFWFVSLVLVLCWFRVGRRAYFLLALGFLLPWIPYLLYVLQAPADWLGQTQDYEKRFELLKPGWYGRNLINEVRRYSPGLGEPGLRWLSRLGFWAFLVALPLSFVALFRRMIKGNRAAALILIPAVTMPALFGLLIYLKLSNYLLTVMPLFALCVSWGALAWWEWAPLASNKGGQTIRRLSRLLLIILLLAIVCEGALRIGEMERAAAGVTPYERYMEEVSATVPAGTRVLGLHLYWLGMGDYVYRSWYVPLLQIDDRYWRPPLSIEQALDRIDPGGIVIDQHMEAYMAERPETAVRIRRWMDARGFRAASRLNEKTYGPMEIFLRSQH